MKRIRIDPAADALLVVDLQLDFCAGGALAVPGGEEILPAINSLMPRFRHLVLTQDWHPRNHRSFASAHEGRRPYDQIDLPYGRQTLWPDHCVQGTRGAEFHPLLTTPPARLIVRKGTDPAIDSYSTFYENDRRTPTGLGGAMRELGVARVVLVGLALDYCVHYSALDARRLGFEALVVRDACRAIDLRGSLDQALAAMGTAGVELGALHHFV